MALANVQTGVKVKTVLKFSEVKQMINSIYVAF